MFFDVPFAGQKWINKASCSVDSSCPSPPHDLATPIIVIILNILDRNFLEKSGIGVDTDLDPAK
jgi:hypothetical protein